MTVVLVTGGSGFLGTHLSHRLTRDGCRVHTLSRRPAFGRSLVPGAQHHVLDLADELGLDELLAEVRPDIIYHLATTSRMPPRSTQAEQARIGLDDIDNLLTLLGKASVHPPQLLVRAGTIAEYGPSISPSREDGPQAPVSPYGVAALAATQLMRNMAPRLPFRAVTARLALLYGAGQSRRFLLPQLIANCSAHRATTLDRPDDVRDWLQVDDAVDALLAIARAPDPPPVLNVATGVGTTARAAGQMISELTRARHLVSYAKAEEPPVSLTANPRLAFATLGWKAKTRFAEGIAKLVGHGQLDRPGSHMLPASLRGLSA